MKINIRESLNRIDRDTFNEYDLLNMYNSVSLTDTQKAVIAKMLAKNVPYQRIYNKLCEFIESEKGQKNKAKLNEASEFYDKDGIKNYKVTCTTKLFGKEEAYFKSLERAKEVAKAWIDKYNKYNMNNLMIYKRERGYDNWSPIFSYAFHEIDYLDKLKESLIAEDFEPQTRGKAYKLFRVKNSKLYPPMVANKDNAPTPIGKWIEAEEGEFAGFSKTGRKRVKSIGGGTLAYRPGWHLSELPLAPQFYRTNRATGEKEFPKDFIWAECEYVMDIDYQDEAMSYGNTETGKFRHSYAGLPRIPEKGYYKYRTNPNPKAGDWIITGAIKVNRLLDDREVANILIEHGIEPPMRQGGEKTLSELGITETFKKDGDKGMKIIKEIKQKRNYGGAFDIEDDQFFTREELNEFADDVVDELNKIPYLEYDCQLISVYMENDIIEITIECGDYDSITISKKIDMRKIRLPRDLKKYKASFVKDFEIEFMKLQDYQESYKRSPIKEQIQKSFRFDLQ